MNSIIRPRRLRRTEAIREMVRENHLTASDFIYPLFIHEKDSKEEISAMPGTYRWDINGLIKEVTRAWELGIRCVVLFPKIKDSFKTEDGAECFNEDGLIPKAEYKLKKEIHKKLENNKIDIIFGTHAIFQKKVIFKKLGLIIIDEQHKFGVNQRKRLSDKGGPNCDVLLMTATPIPRTLTMTIYGDMDISIIREKPKNRKPIKTYSKLEVKIEDVLKFIKKEINLGNQIFWVCPLIEESKKLDHSSAIKKYEYLESKFPNQVCLLHGKTDVDEKNEILNNFLNNKFKILVSTTIIEVGIDFPNANVIIIENANKFGLSQLHQLRGRVGRGNKESSCVLMFKSNLSENAKKRINILKDSNDGFKISEEDMKLRGFGDILGFKQSGIKNFKLADPIHNHNLFILAEKEIKRIENEKEDIGRFKPLIKLYDRADIINDIA